MADVKKFKVSLSGMAVSEFERLKQLLGCTDDREVILKSLKWTYFCANETSNGAKHIIEKDGKAVEVVFPFKSH